MGWGLSSYLIQAQQSALKAHFFSAGARHLLSRLNHASCQRQLNCAIASPTNCDYREVIRKFRAVCDARLQEIKIHV